MRAININTKATPKTFPLAKISCNLMLPGLPDGTTKMLNRASHHTQRRDTRPNPTSSESQKKTKFISRLKKKMDGPMPRGSSRGIIQKTRNASLIIRTVRKITTKLTKTSPNDKESRIGTPGPYNKLSRAGVLVMGSFLDQTARAIAERKELRAVTDTAAPSQP